MKTLYETFGIPTNATEQQIKQAYRQLALKWHPDKNASNREESLEVFQNLSLSYRILSNKQSREEYDTQLLREYLRQQSKTNQFIQQALNKFNDLKNIDELNKEVMENKRSKKSSASGIYKKIRKYLSQQS